jgi:hypothetical protein
MAVNHKPSATPSVAIIPSSAGFASVTAGSATASAAGVDSSTSLGASATAGALVSSAIVSVVLMWHGVVSTRKGGSGSRITLSRCQARRH